LFENVTLYYAKKENDLYSLYQAEINSGMKKCIAEVKDIPLKLFKYKNYDATSQERKNFSYS